MSRTGYKIRGIEPPDLGTYPAQVRKLFWQWVVDFGLKRKDKELSQGLDKDGKPLRPILPATRKHRRSAMTPSGKGDPSAPPLTPGHQKSRTRSLLAGRVYGTQNGHFVAEFYWRYDAWTGDSWSVVLAAQAKKGRDVFGLSKDGTAWVKARAWAKWAQYKAGVLKEATRHPAVSPGVPQIGNYDTTHATFGIGVNGAAKFGQGQWTGGLTHTELASYFRGTAKATIPSRAANPRAVSGISGPGYNRLLAHTWGQSSGPGRPPGSAAPGPARPGPRKPAPKPVMPQIAGKKVAPKVAKPAAPPRPGPPPQPAFQPIDTNFTTHAEVTAWAQQRFPNAKLNLEPIPVETWKVIAKEIDLHVEKWPAIATRLQRFGAMSEAEIEPGVIAQAAIGSGRLLEFNPQKWADLRRLDAEFSRAVDSGWMPKEAGWTTARYYVTHEIGHLIDGLLTDTDRAKRNRLEQLFGKPFDQAARYVRFEPEKARTISQYASTSVTEAFAEAFAAARYGRRSKNPIVQKFREELGLDSLRTRVSAMPALSRT